MTKRRTNLGCEVFTTHVGGVEHVTLEAPHLELERERETADRLRQLELVRLAVLKNTRTNWYG